MINIGVVGLGFIGNIHLEAYRRIPNAKVVAICTSSHFDDSFEGRVYRDYDQFLQQEDIDVVDICLPTFLHEEYVIKAARAGKHIICEKPLTLTVESANRIIEEIRHAKVRLFVGHTLRFWPEYEKIKELSKAKLKDVEIVHAKRLGQLPTWSNWFLYPEKSGGALFDLHIHDIDFLTYLLGEVDRVYAVGSKNEHGAWNHVMTTLTFKNKAIAFVEASHKMPKFYPFTMSFRMQSSTKTVDFELKAGENIESNHRSEFTVYDGKEIFDVTVDKKDAFENELAYFIDCLQNGAENEIIPLEDVLYTLRLMKMIEASLETGREMKVFHDES